MFDLTNPEHFYGSDFKKSKFSRKFHEISDDELLFYLNLVDSQLKAKTFDDIKSFSHGNYIELYPSFKPNWYSKRKYLDMSVMKAIEEIYENFSNWNFCLMSYSELYPQNSFFHFYFPKDFSKIISSNRKEELSEFLERADLLINK